MKRIMADEKLAEMDSADPKRVKRYIGPHTLIPTMHINIWPSPVGAELTCCSRGYVRRVLSNMHSAARSKERRMWYITETAVSFSCCSAKPASARTPTARADGLDTSVSRSSPASLLYLR
jgi:hypothetical protein